MEKQTKRILLVEDQSTVAILMKESLGALGPIVQVHSVASGEDALKEMETGKWDLVVTDHRMPGITGLQLIETMKERTPATLTILITAYGSEELEQAASQLRVYHYMTKPFPLVDLVRVVRDALELQNGNGATLRVTPPEKEFRPAIKIALGGEGNVGKTALIRRLCTGKFDDKRAMTIGVDFHLYDIQASEATTRLIVWDVSGQDHFAFTRRAFYRGSKAVGLVYDVSSRESFERLDAWRREIQELLPEIAIVLAANKTDLPRVVSPAEGAALAEEWGVTHFETSCLSGEGVHEFFETLAEKSVEQLAVQHSPWMTQFQR